MPAQRTSKSVLIDFMSPLLSVERVSSQFQWLECPPTGFADRDRCQRAGLPSSGIRPDIPSALKRAGSGGAPVHS